MVHSCLRYWPAYSSYGLSTMDYRLNLSSHAESTSTAQSS